MPNSDTAPLLPKSSEKGKGKYYSNSSLSKYSSTPASGSSSKHAKTTSSSLEYPETVSAGPSSSKNPAASEPEIQEIIDLDLFNTYGYCQSRDTTEAFMEAWASKFHGKAENVACKYREIIKLADTWAKKETKDEEEEKLKVLILDMCDKISIFVGHFLYMGPMTRSTATKEYSDGLEACEGVLSHALLLVEYKKEEQYKRMRYMSNEEHKWHMSKEEYKRMHDKCEEEYKRMHDKCEEEYKRMRGCMKTIIAKSTALSVLLLQAKARAKYPKLKGFAPIALFTSEIKGMFAKKMGWTKTGESSV